MKRILPALTLALLSVASIAQEGPSPPGPNTILFITSVSSEERAYLMEQSFATAWQARDRTAMIFNFRYAAYSFFPSKAAFDLTCADLAERLRNRRLRLIVAQGDPSIDLAVPFGKLYFPDVPIISIEATDQERFKYPGQNQLYQFNSHDYGAAILRLGHRLFPNARRAFFLVRTGPDTQTYQAFVASLQAEFPQVQLTTVLNPTRVSVDEALRSSPRDALVILLSPGWEDATGRALGVKELVSALEAEYGLPVFSFIREYAGDGLVGGVGISAGDYGRTVARVGLSLVLDGRVPEAWMSSEGLSSTFVDYEALRRFGGDMGSIPEGAEIVNPPIPVWVRYRGIFEAALVLLSLGIVVLVFNILSRRKERAILIKSNAALELKVDARTRDLQESNQELAASNENLRIMMRRAEAMQEKLLRHAREVTLGRLTSNIAHELNSPLNAIESANGAMRTVLADAEGGIIDRILELDDGQRGLVKRYAPRALEAAERDSSPSQPGSFALTGRLAGLDRASALAAAEELGDAGLSELGDEELRELTEPRSKPVVDLLFRLSVLGRSTKIVESAMEKIIDVLNTVREYVTGLHPEGHYGLVELGDSMERALLLFKNRLPPTVTLETDFQTVPTVRGNKALLIRLWTHLVQNALQAMKGGGRLRITIDREGEFDVVSVDDEGEGIPPAIADSLFEPFVTSKPFAEGIGVGLAYCKRIVESMSGTISYASKPKGTVFTVRFPVDEVS